MLEEIGQPYEFVKAGPHSPEVLALNPSGKVPVLTDGDAVLTDSTAILTYLADKHHQLTYPAGSIERAHQDALLHCVLDEIDAVLWTAARHGFVLPEEHRVPAVKDSLKWEFARNLDRLAARFQGPFLMGETMTFADIVFAHCLNWAFGAKFPIENEALLAYGKAMRGREAFKRVMALNQG
jgi:glutathione S-transferase